MILIVIPTFWNTCHSSIVNTPAHRYVPNRSADRWAMRQIRTSTMTNSDEQDAAPDEPELLADGGEREVGPDHRDVAPLVSGPCSQPLPNSRRCRPPARRC